MSGVNFVEVIAKKQMTHKAQTFKTGDIFSVLVEEAAKLVAEGLVELLKPKGEAPKGE